MPVRVKVRVQVQVLRLSKMPVILCKHVFIILGLHLVYISLFSWMYTSITKVLHKNLSPRNYKRRNSPKQ